jgi:hypothetical protein
MRILEVFADAAGAEVMLIISTTLWLVQNVKTYGTFEIITYCRLKTLLFKTPVSREL